MEESYDITESLFSAKADEGMIAFTGFEMGASDDLDAREGVLKISAFNRPDSNGYLTLTFLIDLAVEQTQRAALHARFRRADQAALTHRLDRDFEMLLEIPLSTFANAERFYVEEMNLYFKRLAGRERPLLEGSVLPTLADLLDIRFQPLEWVDQNANAEAPAPDQSGSMMPGTVRRPGV
jgi:hypothetical protein